MVPALVCGEIVAMVAALAVALVAALAVALAVVVAMELTSSIRLIFEDDVADALSRLVKQVLDLLSLRVVEVGAV